eukprot:494435-Hanusia_phi.AAC.1
MPSESGGPRSESHPSLAPCVSLFEALKRPFPSGFGPIPSHNDPMARRDSGWAIPPRRRRPPGPAARRARQPLVLAVASDPRLPGHRAIPPRLLRSHCGGSACQCPTRSRLYPRRGSKAAGFKPLNGSEFRAAVPRRPWHPLPGPSVQFETQLSGQENSVQSTQ